MKNINQPIIVEVSYETSIDSVWSALTELDEMTKWYFPTISSFQPVIGFETRFSIQVENRIFLHIWKVTEVIPKKKIAYEWRFEGYEGRSKSVFELFEEDQKTALCLTATVLEEFPENIPEFKRESAVEGWNYLLKESLKKYLKEH